MESERIARSERGPGGVRDGVKQGTLSPPALDSFTTLTPGASVCLSLCLWPAILSGKRETECPERREKQ